jgi:hypothetical protein
VKLDPHCSHSYSQSCNATACIMPLVILTEQRFMSRVANTTKETLKLMVLLIIYLSLGTIVYRKEKKMSE